MQAMKWMSPHSLQVVETGSMLGLRIFQANTGSGRKGRREDEGSTQLETGPGH